MLSHMSASHHTPSAEPFSLVRARLNRGLSRRQAAVEIGIAQASLRSLEEGGTIHPAGAKKVADFFGVQVTDLMPVTPARLADEPKAAA